MKFLIFNESNLAKALIYFVSFFWQLEFLNAEFFLQQTIGFHSFYIIYSTEVSGFFISSFGSLSSLNIFTETNSSWLLYESIKALEITTSIVSNLGYPSNTIFSYFFFFLIIDLYFLVSAGITQIFNPTAEVLTPTGTATNEVNAEIETQPVIVEPKISKC